MSLDALRTYRWMDKPCTATHRHRTLAVLHAPLARPPRERARAPPRAAHDPHGRAPPAGVPHAHADVARGARVPVRRARVAPLCEPRRRRRGVCDHPDRGHDGGGGEEYARDGGVDRTESWLSEGAPALAFACALTFAFALTLTLTFAFSLARTRAPAPPVEEFEFVGL